MQIAEYFLKKTLVSSIKKMKFINMKKLITIALLLGLITVSCKKDTSDYCWVCTIDCIINADDQTFEKCIDDPGNYDPQFKDRNGNDCNTFCQRK